MDQWRVIHSCVWRCDAVRMERPLLDAPSVLALAVCFLCTLGPTTCVVKAALSHNKQQVLSAFTFAFCSCFFCDSSSTSSNWRILWIFPIIKCTFGWTFQFLPCRWFLRVVFLLLPLDDRVCGARYYVVGKWIVFVFRRLCLSSHRFGFPHNDEHKKTSWTSRGRRCQQTGESDVTFSDRQ